MAQSPGGSPKSLLAAGGPLAPLWRARSFIVVALYLILTYVIAPSDLTVQSLALVATVFAILAISLDLVAGMLGLYSLGQGGFFAIGANTTVVAIVAFATSGLFAGVAGVLIGPSTFANPYLGDTFGTFGFIAMMIGGGTEKPASAMFGGLLLGVLSEGANATINSQASDWFPFLVLVVILIVSPRGLFSSGGLFRRLRPATHAPG